jgi:PAS domain S-box-containing protein
MTISLENVLTSGRRLADASEVRRFKALNLTLLLFVLLAPALGILFYVVDASFLFQLMVISALVGAAVLLTMRLTGSLALGGNLGVFVLWGTLFLVRWYSGGISSDSLILLSWIWNAVLILLAIFITGYVWGTIWSCLIFLESGLVVFLYQRGFPFPNLIPAEISPVYALGFYLVGLLTMLFLAFFFEKGRDDAQRREEEKSRMLVELRRYMEDILERLPVPTFVLDHNHRVVQWNRACHEMTGIGREEILGKRVWEGFALDEKGSLADKLLDNPDMLYEKYSNSIISMTETGSFSVETILPRLNNGMRAIIQTAPILDQDGKVKGAVQTIQETGDGDSPYRGNGGSSGNGIEGSIYPIFKIDSAGKISGWNNAAEEAFGYLFSEMLGKSPMTMVAKSYRTDFRDTLIRGLRGESFQAKEWKYYTNEGQPVFVLAHVQPVFGPSNKVFECIVVNTDITDLMLRLKKLGRTVMEGKERYRKLSDEYSLLKSNIATYLRKRE